MYRWYRDDDELDLSNVSLSRSGSASGGPSTLSSGSIGLQASGARGGVAASRDGVELTGHLRDLPAGLSVEKLSSTFINQCFFVFDDYGQNEEADENEILLYFHPNHASIPVRARLLLQGQVHGIIAFASSFVEEAEATAHGRAGGDASTRPPSASAILHDPSAKSSPTAAATQSHSIVIRMHNCKFAVKRVGSVYMALSGPIADGDSCIQSYLDTIYSTFRFFNGDVMRLLHEAGGDRRVLLDSMEDAFERIRPLIRHYRKSAIAFLPPLRVLPYHDCASSRHVVSASQLINTVTSLGCLGGAVFVGTSLLCTHISSTLTSLILSLVEAQRAEDECLPLHVRDERTTREPHFLPVFVTHEQMEELTAILHGDTPGEPPHEDTFDNLPDAYSHVRCAPDDGKYIGLCVIWCDDVALATLMSVDQLFDRQFTSKLRLSVDRPLSALEQDMGSVASTARPSYSGRTSYNMLAFDPLMCSVSQVLPARSRSEVDQRFLPGTAFAHERFVQDDVVSKIMLLDHSGVLMAKRAFGRELFFQKAAHINVPVYGQVFADARGFERIDEELRSVQAAEPSVPFAL